MRATHLSGLLAGLTLLAATPARADIYKCIDATGHITYSNVATKGCTKMNLAPVSTIPSAAPAVPAARTSTPASFPRVDAGAQKARDEERRRILEQELAAEQKSLDEAKRALAEQEATILPEERLAPQQRCTPVALPDGKTGQSCAPVGGGINNAKVLERRQPYQDKAALHERNVEAIRKELQNLR